MSFLARILGAAALFIVLLACGAPQFVQDSGAPTVTPETTATTEATPPTDDTPAPSPTAEEPTATEPPARTLVPLTASVVTDANVRDQPAMEGSAILTSVRTGETVQLLMRDEGGLWYGIVGPRDARGWVSASLLTVDPATAAQVPIGTPAELNSIAPTAVALAGAPVSTTPTLVAGSQTASAVTGANVRDQPTIEGSVVLTSLQMGETVQLLMRDQSGLWYGIVDPRGVRGWVSASLLSVDPAVAVALPVGTTEELRVGAPTPAAPAATPTPASGG